MIHVVPKSICYSTGPANGAKAMDAKELWCEERKHLDIDRLLDSMEAARQDRLWFYQHIEDIRKEHVGEWVAVKNMRIVDSDCDHDRLMERLIRRPGGAKDTEILQVLPKGTIAVY